MSGVNIVKRIKSNGRWKVISIPRNSKGNYDWNSLADGRCYVEWYMGGTRRRASTGVTTAQALETQRLKRHELEGRKLGVPGLETARDFRQAVYEQIRHVDGRQGELTIERMCILAAVSRASYYRFGVPGADVDE